MTTENNKELPLSIENEIKELSTPVSLKQESKFKFNFQMLMLRFATFLYALMIVYVATSGYAELFVGDKKVTIPFFGEMPTITVLFCFIELSVLLLVSMVFDKWYTQTKLFKSMTIVALIVLTLITTAGTYGYLDRAYNSTGDVAETMQDGIEKEEELIKAIEKSIEDNEQTIALEFEKSEAFKKEIEDLRDRKAVEVEKLNKEITRYRSCEASSDCMTRTGNIRSVIDDLNKSEESARLDKERIDAAIRTLEEDNAAKRKDISNRLLKKTEESKDSSGELLLQERKGATYSKFVSGLFGIIGIEVKNGLDVFFMVLSAIVYPLYVLINVFIGLNSPSNIAHRERFEEEGGKLAKEREKIRKEKLRLAAKGWFGRRLLSYVVRNRLRKVKVIGKRPKKGYFASRILNYVHKNRVRKVQVIEQTKEVIVEVIKTEEVVVEKINNLVTEVPMVIEKPTVVEVPKIEQVVHNKMVIVPETASLEEIKKAAGDIADIVTLEEYVKAQNANKPEPKATKLEAEVVNLEEVKEENLNA